MRVGTYIDQFPKLPKLILSELGVLGLLAVECSSQRSDQGIKRLDSGLDEVGHSGF